MKNVKVLLAPSLELAKEVVNTENVVATVEAEYGDTCIEGTKYTLAHHGSRSHNPAPCKAKVKPISEGTILISHMDLDTVGGVLALMNKKPENKEFWDAAEYIDINGSHHICEFDLTIQKQLNAALAYQAEVEQEEIMDIKDVTEDILNWGNVLEPVLNTEHPKHNELLEKGEEWVKSVQEEIESKLITETDYVRVFKTDGISCHAAYYSPNLLKDCPATVVLNTKKRSITVAFKDGGAKISARAFVQSLWGPDAGGHDGIAGSPRGWKLSEEDLAYEFARASAKIDLYFSRQLEYFEKDKKTKRKISMYKDENFGIGE